MNISKNHSRKEEIEVAFWNIERLKGIELGWSKSGWSIIAERK